MSAAFLALSGANIGLLPLVALPPPSLSTSHLNRSHRRASVSSSSVNHRVGTVDVNEYLAVGGGGETSEPTAPAPQTHLDAGVKAFDMLVSSIVSPRDLSSGF